MKSVYFVQTNIGNYVLTAIGDTPENALDALRRSYKEKNCEDWKTDMDFETWIEYSWIRPTERKLNESFWM